MNSMSLLGNKEGEKTFYDIYKKVPDKFYDITGFVIVISMMVILWAEAIYRLFTPEWKINVYMMFYFVVGLAAELFAVFYVVSLFYREEKFSIKKVLKNNVWDLLLAGMFIWIIISSLLAEDRYLAMHGTDYRQEGLLTLMVYASLYVSAKAVKSRKLIIWIFRSFAILISTLSVPSLMEACPALGKLVGDNLYNFYYVGGHYSSVFKNINHFGYVLTIGIMVLAGLFIFEEKIWAKVLSFIMYCFNVWSLIINDTFGSYLAVAFGVVFLGVLIIIKNKKNLKYSILIVASFIIISACMMGNSFGLRRSISTTYNDINSGVLNETAGTGRIGLWKQAFVYIGEKPVFGHGPEGVYARYIMDGFDNDRPHNEYIQHAVFYGIPAGVMYLAALITMFVYCIRRISKLDIVMLTLGGVVFAYCISAFFGNTMYYTSPYFFTFLGVLSICDKRLKEEIQ